jgi:hypothetical protein
MKNDITYHNECNCIYASGVRSDECKKRYYDVFDLENSEYKTIGICSETIRLEAQRIKHEESGWNIRYRIDQFIESIIGQYIHIYNDGHAVNGNDLFDRKVTVTLCNRPYMRHIITVKNSLKLMLDGNHYVRGPLFNQINDYLVNTTFKKYKTKYKESIAICKSFEKGHVFGTKERELKVTKLFNNILEFKTKNK